MVADPRVLPFEPKEDGQKSVGYVCLICGMTGFEFIWELAEHLEIHDETDA